MYGLINKIRMIAAFTSQVETVPIGGYGIAKTGRG